MPVILFHNNLETAADWPQLVRGMVKSLRYGVARRVVKDPK